MRALILFSALLICALFVACGGGDTKLDESLTTLKVGDCVDSADTGNVTGITTVDCGKEGALVVIKLFDMPEATAFPGSDAVGAAASAAGGCPQTTVQYLGPTKDSWEQVNDRQVICFAKFDLVPASP